MIDPEPFIDANTLAAYSGGKITFNDPRVADALAGASAAIRRYCGWHIYPEIDDTLTLDGPGGRELALPTKNLVSVTSITEVGTVVDPTSYDWSALGEVRKTWGCWSSRYRSIVASIVHGYDEVPDIARIVLAAVSRELASPTGATREQAGQVSVTWATTAPGVSGGLALMANELAILDTYRIVSV